MTQQQLINRQYKENATNSRCKLDFIQPGADDLI